MSTDDSNSAAAVQYEIKPYTGVGSGVLKSGTLIKLNDAGQYEGPDSIVGTIDAAGTWSINVREAKHFPMWQQIVDKKADFKRIINVDMGMIAEAKLLDIRLEPSGDSTMVVFEIEGADGKTDQWSSRVEDLGITGSSKQLSNYRGLRLSSTYVGDFILQRQEDIDAEGR